MDKFLAFVTNHWELWLAFVVVLIAFIATEVKDRLHGPRRVSTQQAVDIMNKQAGVVLDIRSKEQYQQGYIINAINIPNKEIKQNLNKIEKYKDKPIIVVCPKGQSAVLCASMLQKQGFSDVSVLTGGMQAWQAANLPTAKS